MAGGLGPNRDLRQGLQHLSADLIGLRPLHQGIDHRRMGGVRFVAPLYPGVADQIIIQLYGAAGHGHLAQIEGGAGAARATPHHHRPDFRCAGKAMRRKRTQQLRQCFGGRAGQKPHPFLTFGSTHLDTLRTCLSYYTTRQVSTPPFHLPQQIYGEIFMTIPKVTRSSVWQAIAEKLMAEITTGQRQSGDKLPTEAELSARFDVNRHTVRRALADLAEKGLVYSRRGAGVFVQSHPISYPIGRRTRMSTNLTALGLQPGRQILSLETRRANQPETTALRLEDDQMVHVLEGVSTADNLPLAVFRSVFPATRFPDMLEQLRQNNSITRAFAAQGLTDYTRAETQLTAKRATADVALHLRLKVGDPILRTISINIDSHGQPVEYGHSWMAGDRVMLQVKDQAP